MMHGEGEKLGGAKDTKYVGNWHFNQMHGQGKMTKNNGLL